MPEEDIPFFSPDSSGILSTDVVAEENLMHFLNDTSPEDIRKKEPEKKEEKTETKDPKETSDKKPVSKELSSEEALSLLEKMDEEEDGEETPKEEEPEKKDENAEGKEEGAEEGDEGEEAETNEDSSNVYASISKELLDLGIFTPMAEDGEEEEFPDGPEEFKERWEIESKLSAGKVLDRFIAKHGPEYQEAFEQIFIKGVPPKEYLAQFVELEDVKNIDLTVEANQEKVIRDSMTLQGYDPEDIENQINKLRNYGDLNEDTAKTHQKLLIKKQEQEKAAKEAKAKEEQEAKKRIRDEYVKSMNTILAQKLKEKQIDGLPLDSEKAAVELFDYMVNEKYQKPRTNEYLTEFDKDLIDLQRPENHVLRLKVGMLLRMLKQDPKLTKLLKTISPSSKKAPFEGITKPKTFIPKDDKKKKTDASSSSKQGGEPKSWF